MSKAHAFIFDLDGTLVDSLRDITDAVNAALIEFDQPRATMERVRDWVGDGLPVLCRRALSTTSDDDVAALAARVACHYRARCTANTRPYPNILKMLDLLQYRHVPAAVFSNKPHALVTQVAGELGLAHYFADLRGYVDEDDKKPSPGCALAIAARLGIEPRDVFFVGDSVVDIETAHNAGMIAVAVTWGFQSVSQLQSSEPDFIVHDPMKIPDLIKKTPD